MKGGHQIASVFALVLGSLAFGAGTPRAFPQEQRRSDHANQQHPASEFDRVPAKARDRRNPLEEDGDAVAAGRKLFVRHCSECHGTDAEGTSKAPSLHADEVQDATPGQLFWIISNGIVRKGMPVWSRLPEAQRWQIIRYLKTLRFEDQTSNTSPQNGSATSHP